MVHVVTSDDLLNELEAPNPLKLEGESFIICMFGTNFMIEDEESARF